MRLVDAFREADLDPNDNLNVGLEKISSVGVCREVLMHLVAPDFKLVSEANQRLEDVSRGLKGLFDEKCRQIVALSNKLAVALSELENSKAASAAKDETISDLTRKLEDSLDHNKKTMVLFSDLQSSHSQLKDKLNVLASQRTGEATDKERMVGEFQEKIVSLEREKNEIEESKDKDINDLSEKLKDMEARKTSLEKEKDEFKEQCLNQQQESLDLKATIENKEAELKELVGRLEESEKLSTELEQAKETIDGLYIRIQRGVSFNKQSLEDISERERIYRSLKYQTAQLETAKRSVEDEKSRLEEEMHRAEEEKVGLESNVKELNEQLDHEKELLAGSKGKLEQQEKEISSLQALLAEKKSELSGTVKKAQMLKFALRTAKLLYSWQQGTFDWLALLRSRETEWRSLLESRDEKLSSLADRLTERKGILDKLEERLQSSRNQLNSAQGANRKQAIRTQVTFVHAAEVVQSLQQGNLDWLGILRRREEEHKEILETKEHGLSKVNLQLQETLLELSRLQEELGKAQSKLELTKSTGKRQLYGTIQMCQSGVKRLQGNLEALQESHKDNSRLAHLLQESSNQHNQQRALLIRIKERHHLLLSQSQTTAWRQSRERKKEKALMTRRLVDAVSLLKTSRDLQVQYNVALKTTAKDKITNAVMEREDKVMSIKGQVSRYLSNLNGKMNSLNEEENGLTRLLRMAAETARHNQRLRNIMCAMRLRTISLTKLHTATAKSNSRLSSQLHTALYRCTPEYIDELERMINLLQGKLKESEQANVRLMQLAKVKLAEDISGKISQATAGQEVELLRSLRETSIM